MSTRHLIAALLCIAYLAIDNVLSHRAMPYLKKRRAPRWLETPLVDKTLFRPEGLPFVRRANRFSLVGGVILVILLFVVYNV